MKVIKHQNSLPLFDQLFDGFFRDEPLHWMQQKSPATSKELVNIMEDENQFSIEMLAPGFRKEDLHIEVDDNRLKLKATQKKEDQEEGPNFLRREFQISSFEREFKLPENRIDEAKIKASFEDGILKVELPKMEDHKKASRLIEVQ